MSADMLKLGKFAYRDTGPVAKSLDYTTVVVIHGLGFHSANFVPMSPFAAIHNSRLVVLNRREYPGSDPYTIDERLQLESVGGMEEGQDALDEFMRQRSCEIFNFLTAFVQQEQVPLPNNNHGGGIILVAWSLGVSWLMPLLLHAPGFSAGETDISRYIRHAIIYDSPYGCFGYPAPEDAYHPFLDETIPQDDRLNAFMRWVSAYYTHQSPNGDGDGLERRVAAHDKSCSLDAATKEQIDGFFDHEAAGFGGSDILQARLGLLTGLNAKYRDQVFQMPRNTNTNFWEALPVVYLCCDRSPYETLWAAISIQKQVLQAKEIGHGTRNILVATMEGANHFAHWDQPQRLMQRLLAVL